MRSAEHPAVRVGVLPDHQIELAQLQVGERGHHPRHPFADGVPPAHGLGGSHVADHRVLGEHGGHRGRVVGVPGREGGPVGGDDLLLGGHPGGTVAWRGRAGPAAGSCGCRSAALRLRRSPARRSGASSAWPRATARWTSSTTPAARASAMRVRVGGAWGFARSRGHDRAGAEAALRRARGPGARSQPASAAGRAGPRAAGPGLVGEPRGARPVRRPAGGQAVRCSRAADTALRDDTAREPSPRRATRRARTRTTVRVERGRALRSDASPSAAAAWAAAVLRARRQPGALLPASARRRGRPGRLRALPRARPAGARAARGRRRRRRCSARRPAPPAARR